MVGVLSKSYAQTETSSGTIEIPSMVSIDLDQIMNNQELRFDKWEYFTNGRTIPSAFNMRVLSNIPWEVTVMADNVYFTPIGEGSPDMPVTLIKVKKNTSSNYLAVSNTPQRFLLSENSNLENSYNVDLMMDGPMNYKAGRYTANIVFSVTAQ